MQFMKAIQVSSLLITLLQSNTKTTTSLTMPAPSNARMNEIQSSTATSIKGNILRSIVKESSKKDETQSSLDINGIVWLEHINLVVGCERTAEYFYEDILGFSRDLDANFHVNLGQQQLHLAAKDGEPAQRVHGSIGLVVPNLKNVRERIYDDSDRMGKELLEGSQFDVLDDKYEEEGYMSISCPWGNIIHLYCAMYDDAHVAPPDAACPLSPHKMVTSHRPGGKYAADRLTIRGKPGIRFIELVCPNGAIPAIRHFYQSLFGCNTHTTQEEGRDVLSVSVGPGVHLLFAESNHSHHTPNKNIKAMEGVHICVYVPNFKSLYEKLTNSNIIWTNPRFTHLDSCDTWEEAEESRTLRFKYIIDLEKEGGGDGTNILLELEHETRPLRHGQYFKVPHYIPN